MGPRFDPRTIQLVASRYTNSAIATRNSPQYEVKKKGKAFPLQAWRGPWVSWRLRLQNNRHMKVVRLSAQRIGCLYPQEGFLVLISVRG